jgi:phosphoribosylformylglycinamidine (FGAM) synthase-like enzyme
VEYGICIKAETHNSPSGLDPYGGAMTGTGGVIRDIAGTGKGAKNISSINIFCLGDPYIQEEFLQEWLKVYVIMVTEWVFLRITVLSIFIKILGRNQRLL